MAATDPLGPTKTATIGNFTLCATPEVRWGGSLGERASNHEQKLCPEGPGRCAAGRAASPIHVEYYVKRFG
jgi:hypothetical protein